MKLVSIFILLLTAEASWQQTSIQTPNQMNDQFILHPNQGNFNSFNGDPNFYIPKIDSNNVHNNPYTNPNIEKNKKILFKPNGDKQYNVSDFVRRKLSLGNSGYVEESNEPGTNNYNMFKSNNFEPKQSVYTDWNEVKDLNADTRPIKPSLEYVPGDTNFNYDPKLDNQPYPEINSNNRITYDSQTEKHFETNTVNKYGAPQDNELIIKTPDDKDYLTKDGLKSFLDDFLKMNTEQTNSEIEPSETRRFITNNEQVPDKYPHDVKYPYSYPKENMASEKLLEHQKLKHLTGIPLPAMGVPFSRRPGNVQQNPVMRVFEARRLQHVFFRTPGHHHMISKFVHNPLHG